MSDEDKNLCLQYVEQFVKNDKSNAILYCLRWNGTNGFYFDSKTPDDIVFELLEKILEGKKVYLEDYKHFLGSVYQHLRWAMLNFFKCRKKKPPLREDDPEMLVTDVFFEGSEEFLKTPDLEQVDKNEDKGTKMSSTFVPFNDEFYADGAEAIIDSLIKKEETMTQREKIFNLFDPEKDIEERFVLEEILGGYKREEIADRLGITPNEVSAIQKRIDRKLLILKKKG